MYHFSDALEETPYLNVEVNSVMVNLNSIGPVEYHVIFRQLNTVELG